MLHDEIEIHSVGAFFVLAACTSQHKAAGENSASASPTSVRTALGAPEGDKPVREGLDAPIVWRRKVASTGSDFLCDEGSDRLDITEARSDGRTLFLDVEHYAQTAERLKTIRTEPIEVSLLLNSCPAPPPTVAGRVYRDWPSPSTATIDVDALPDGELDLTLRAFGQQRTIPLRKQGRSVTYLALEQRAGYSYHPGDPSRGIGPVSSLDDVHCPGMLEVLP